MNYHVIKIESEYFSMHVSCRNNFHAFKIMVVYARLSVFSTISNPRSRNRGCAYLMVSNRRSNSTQIKYSVVF